MTGLALAGAAAVLLAQRALRPATHRPGEALPEITAKLSRDLPPETPAPRWTDRTAESGLAGFRAFAGPRSSQLPEDMGSGAAWGDFDNDGDDDLLLVAAGGALTLPAAERAPSSLFENLGDGSFRRVADFPEPRIVGMGAAWGDFDADGWLDLVVTGYDVLWLFRNRQGRFVRSAALPDLPGFWAGAAWGDFDNDRDLDLYVCGYVRYVEDASGTRRASDQYGTAVPYTLNPAAFEPERNLLFENRGGAFTEVALLYGVSNPEGRSLSALWHDFDEDGRLDLYVANDVSDNALYLNRGETFEDASHAAWVADYRGAMGLAAGDWNRDGDDDIFITHWLAQENALYDSQLVQRRAAGQGGAGLVFMDQAAAVGLGQIALPMVGWGTEFLDVDADGWLDLVVANGSTLETGTPPLQLKAQSPFLLWSQQGRHFHDLAPLAGPWAEPRVGRGLAVSDYDADGDLDVVIVDRAGGAQLLANEMAQGRWLELRLRSRLPSDETEARGWADGTAVVVRVGATELRRTVGGASYLSQSTRRLHFGLGEAERADRIEVRWLGGATAVYGPLAADTLWELREDDPTPRRLRGPVPAPAATGGPTTAERDRRLAFWTAQRAAMDAMKRDQDLPGAVALFRQALALDPGHEDSRYYLAHSLAALGETEAALAELDALRQLAPGSHRAHQQWGVLRAATARGPADLVAATAALERAFEINGEETGSLLALGEIALLQGRPDLAEQRLAWACNTNPKAAGGFFLRAYVAWKRGDRRESVALLEAARGALGDDWKPEGAVGEGDVRSRMHLEATPLTPFWRRWSGATDPDAAFASLDAYLTAAADSA